MDLGFDAVQQQQQHIAALLIMIMLRAMPSSPTRFSFTVAFS